MGVLPALATDSYTVNAGATLDITEFSECKSVTNAHASGLSIMVPTKTQAEWQSLYNNLPVGVTAVGCGPACDSWTIRTSAANNGWHSVTYGNGLFVAVAYSGTGNRVMTSPDGITWTIRTSAADNWWTSVTYGNGLFVAVAYSGTGNRVMTSPDGITWTLRTSVADNEWRSVTYGNGMFVAVATSGIGDRVMTSPDGITWTSGASAADNGWHSVTYGNGLFVAVAWTGTGNRVMTMGSCGGGGGGGGPGELYAWGAGLHGNGSFWSTQSTPIKIGTDTNWTTGSAGQAHSCAITAGKLYCWGDNTNGKTGISLTSGETQSPTQVGASTTWTAVEAGAEHTCGIDGGKLYCWGSNSSAVTGLGTQSGTQSTPAQVGSATTWTGVDVSGYGSCGINGGKLYCWGDNMNGRTGLGITSGYTTSPTQVGAATDWAKVFVGGTTSCGIKTGKTLFCWAGAYGNSPMQVGADTNWETLTSSPGSSDVCGVKTNGTLYCWTGIAIPTQFETATDWSSVAIGNLFRCGIRAGKAYCWGDNTSGRTGLGTTTGTTTSPAQVGTATTWSGIFPSSATRAMGILGTGGGGGPSVCTVDAQCTGGGKCVGGSCWYLGAYGESCDTVCSSNGGYNDATRTYAGSSGTDANCLSVLTALNGGTGSMNTSSSPGFGCWVYDAAHSYARYRSTGTTDASTALGTTRRACACNVAITDITTTMRSVSMSSVDNSVYNHTNINIGTAAADRLVIVIAGGLRSGTARSISSISIGGTNATIAAQQTGLGNGALAIAYRLVPSGTTTDVVVTYSGTMDRASIVAYTMTGQTSNTPTDTFNVSGNGNVSSTLDVLAGGTALGAYYGQDVASVVWSGLNEDNDFANEASDQMSTALKAFTAAQTNLSVGVTVSGSEDHLVGASWR
jgi:hypothetical protein